MNRRARHAVEWPTLMIAAFCYAGFIATTVCAQFIAMPFAIILLSLTLTLYSSLSHEVLHGHPFRKRSLNEVLVFPAMGLLIPYGRFRDTHLAHHNDPSLTDPYDDPETNFVDPAVWNDWCGVRRAVYQFNNTLLGRVLIGPIIGLVTFYANDYRLARAGDKTVSRAYFWHGVGFIPVAWWLASVSTMPVWAYLVSVYASHSILKIRTFLEHRAHEVARCRSVIIEDRGPLAFLFLNNNLHAVHHARPGLPWYHLWGFYQSRRSHFLKRNGGYSYRSYADIFRQYFLHSKDPVPHSLWHSNEPEKTDNSIPLP